MWEQAAGLHSSLVSSGPNQSASSDATAFNSARGPLMLGLLPLSEDLEREAEKVLRDEATSDPHASQTLNTDLQLLRPTQAPGLSEPTASDALPLPPTFKAIDVRREVERVRDTRKRIRLDPSQLSGQARNASSIGPQVAMSRARSLPSICAYTLHDTSERFAWINSPLLRL
jgi:transcription initiation factor TFIID subunit 5